MTIKGCVGPALGDCIGPAVGLPVTSVPWSDTLTINPVAQLLVSLDKYAGVWDVDDIGNASDGGFSDADLNGKTVTTCVVRRGIEYVDLFLYIDELNVPMDFVKSVTVTGDNGYGELTSANLVGYNGDDGGRSAYSFRLIDGLYTEYFWNTTGSKVVEFTGVE